MSDLTRVTIPCTEQEILIDDECEYISVTTNDNGEVAIDPCKEEHIDFFYVNGETVVYSRAELVLRHVQSMLRDRVDREVIDNYCADERSVLEGRV